MAEFAEFLRACLKNRRFLNFNPYWLGNVLGKLGMPNYPSSLTDSEWNHYFRLWAKLGYWEQIHHTIRDMVRLAVGEKSPDRCDYR